MGTTIFEQIFIFLIIIIIGIIITYFIIGDVLFSFWKNSLTKNEKETFNILGMHIPDPPSPQQIGDDLAKPFKELGDKMKGGFDEIGDAVKGVANKAKDTLLGPLMDIFEKAAKAFEQIPKRFTLFGNGFKTVFQGIGDEFEGLGLGLKDSFYDIGTLIEYSGVFVFTYLECGVQFIKNLHNCILYYSLQAIGQIFYMPIRFMLFLCYSAGLDLYSSETSFWNYVEWFDGIIFKYMGFHFSHFPKSVRNQCYNCRRLKKQTVVNIAEQINDDFNTKIPNNLKHGIDVIKEGGDEILSAFRPGYV